MMHSVVCEDSYSTKCISLPVKKINTNPFYVDIRQKFELNETKKVKDAVL